MQTNQNNPFKWQTLPTPAELERLAVAANPSGLSLLRAGRFTASEISVLLSSPTKFPAFSVAAVTYILEKAYESALGYGMPPSGSGDAAQWGINNEPIALSLLGLAKFDGVCLHPTLNLAATPDSFDGEIITEIKTPYSFAKVARYFLIKTTSDVLSVCPEYFWQVIAQILAANAKSGQLVFFDARREKFNTIFFNRSEMQTHINTLTERVLLATEIQNNTLNLLR